MIEKDDWRLVGQDRYLKNVKLIKKKYSIYKKEWDHDHCEFCSKKFTQDGNNESANVGYTTEDNYHWICCDCFEDFKDMFNWQFISE